MVVVLSCVVLRSVFFCKLEGLYTTQPHRIIFTHTQVYLLENQKLNVANLFQVDIMRDLMLWTVLDGTGSR